MFANSNIKNTSSLVHTILIKNLMQCSFLKKPTLLNKHQNEIIKKILQTHTYFIGHFMYVLSNNQVTIPVTLENPTEQNHNKNTFWYYRIA